MLIFISTRATLPLLEAIRVWEEELQIRRYIPFYRFILPLQQIVTLTNQFLPYQTDLPHNYNGLQLLLRDYGNMFTALSKVVT